MTTIAEEKKKHLTYLKKIKSQPAEVKNVLTYTVQKFSDTMRLEYMAFVEDNNLKHSWGALLAWWRYRKNTTNLDKSQLQSIKRSMENRKRQEYTLLATRRQCKKKHSPPIRINDDSDDEDTPPPPPPPSQDDTDGDPPPPPPPKKKDTGDTIILQKLIMRMSPRDWYEFMLTHDQHKEPLLTDLRKFLHTKYINEENTHRRSDYGQLCNIVEYPLSFRPYEEDFTAKRKLKFDPSSPIDQPNCNKPDTFIN